MAQILLEKMQAFLRQKGLGIEIHEIRPILQDSFIQGQNILAAIKTDKGDFFFKVGLNDSTNIFYEYRGFEVLKNLLSVGENYIFFPKENVLIRPLKDKTKRYLDLINETLEELEKKDENTLSSLIDLETRISQELLYLYRLTVGPVYASENRKSAIHKLFYNRLHAENRLNGDIKIESSGETLTFEELAKLKLVVNDIPVGTLTEILDMASRYMSPDRDVVGVVGHGDGHGGNIFINSDFTWEYYDFANSGLHSWVADIAKPIFYTYLCPSVEYEAIFRSIENITVSVKKERGTLYITHDYKLHDAYKKLLEIRATNLIKPFLDDLRTKGLYSPDWKQELRAFLCGCLLLARNIFDYPDKIAFSTIAQLDEILSDKSFFNRLLFDIDPYSDENRSALVGDFYSTEEYALCLKEDFYNEIQISIREGMLTDVARDSLKSICRLLELIYPTSYGVPFVTQLANDFLHGLSTYFSNTKSSKSEEIEFVKMNISKITKFGHTINAIFTKDSTLSDMIETSGAKHRQAI